MTYEVSVMEMEEQAQVVINVKYIHTSIHKSSTTIRICRSKKGSDVNMKKTNHKAKTAGYYNFQEIQDKLYADSSEGKIFTNLISNLRTEISKVIQEAVHPV